MAVNSSLFKYEDPQNVLEAEDNKTQVNIHHQERRKTCKDLPFFIAFVTCVFIIIPIGIVFAMGSDLNRFIYGYDRHGNTCGIKNQPIQGINCSGQDMTLKPIALLKYYPLNKCFRYSPRKILPDRCVDSCNPPNKLVFHRCFPPGDINLDSSSKHFKQINDFLHSVSEYRSTIATMTILGLGLTLLIFQCLKCYQVNIMFWALVVFQLTLAITATAIFWHKYVTSGNKQVFYLFASLGSLAYVMFILLFVFFLHKNLTLVISWYDEAIKAVFKMPSLLFQSLMILVTLIILAAVMVFIIMLIYSGGCLEQSEDRFTFVYKRNAGTAILILYMIIVLLWIFAFGEGWQTMIVGSSVNRYHFARNKATYRHSLVTSYKRIFPKHFGTISCGSLVITIFAFMKGFVEYITRKVYIQAATHNQAFCKSTSRVIKLLSWNVLLTATFTGFGYIVTCGLSFFILLVTVGVGMWMNQEVMISYYIQLAVFVGAVISHAITVFILQILNIAADTIFLNFSEKQLQESSGDDNASLELKDQGHALH